MAHAARLASQTRQGTILVVEDELRSQRQLRRNLELLGYRVITLEQGRDAAEMVDLHTPDLVVLDVALRDADGFETCRRIREHSSVPLIFLSAFDQPAQRARGLQLGADDYVGKPFDPVEFGARIEAVLRRSQGRALQAPRTFRCGPLMIDYEQRLVTMNGAEIALSRTEYRLLECLARHAGRTLIADTLLSKVWGPEYAGDYASLHLYISRLRRKLGEDSRKPRLIVTKPGVGYTMPQEHAAE